MTVVSAVVGVGNTTGRAFYAAIDTIIYGRQYAQGQEIDTSSWNRRQILQYLSLGLMIGPPVSSDGTPGYLTPCTVISADQSTSTAIVRLPSGQMLSGVKVTGTAPRSNDAATLVITTNDRWVIGSGVPSDLITDSVRTSSLNVVGDATLGGDTSIPKGAEPGWVATSADEFGTVMWSPPSEAGGSTAVIISDGVAPPTDGLDPGAVWYNPSEDSSGPSFAAFVNSAIRISAATVNGTYATIPQFGGYTTNTPGPGLVLCDWTAALNGGGTAAGNMLRVGLWPTADAGYVSTNISICNSPLTISQVNGQSFIAVNQATSIDWDWRGFNTNNDALGLGSAIIRFSFFPNATMTNTTY